MTIDASTAGSVAIAVRNACPGSGSPLTADGVPGTRGHLGGIVVAMRIARLHGGVLTYEQREGSLIARLSIPVASTRGGNQPERAPVGRGAPH